MTETIIFLVIIGGILGSVAWVIKSWRDSVSALRESEALARSLAEMLVKMRNSERIMNEAIVDASDLADLARRLRRDKAK